MRAESTKRSPPARRGPVSSDILAFAGPPPIQVCPRLHFEEHGIRSFPESSNADLNRRYGGLAVWQSIARWVFRGGGAVWKRRLFGRAYPTVEVRWPSEACPRCGRDLQRGCPSCLSWLVLPDDMNCRGCGEPYPWMIGRDREDKLVTIKNWTEGLDPIRQFSKTKIYVRKGDLRAVDVEAIVAADNLMGRMIGDAADAIARAGGDAIEEESMEKAIPTVGAAWVTRAGQLPFRHIVHVAALDEARQTNVDILRTAVRNSLMAADKLGLRSLGYPALGTGTARIGLCASGNAMGAAMLEFFGQHAETSLEAIVVVLLDPRSFDEFKDAFTQALAIRE